MNAIRKQVASASPSASKRLRDRKHSKVDSADGTVNRYTSSSVRKDFGAVFSTALLSRDWRVLCEKIGERRAGTPGELRAAEFIARRFKRSGLTSVRLETFPCTSLRSAATQVEERRGRAWRQVEAVAIVGAPGTPGGRPVEGEVAWIELPEALERVQPQALRGRILVVFGGLPTDSASHRRLLAAQPLAVVHVDDRLPFPWTKNDGVYPHWVRTYGMLPTVSVPYTEAWRWRRDAVRRLRVRVDVEQTDALSQNVVGELRGRDSSLPEIVLTAHHDTQCGNPGADDNASGVICLLAIADAFAARRMRRTLRFISFGTEEQLSVGAAAYVASHRSALSRTGLVVNFDSVSSPLGHFVLSVAGSGALARHAKRQLVEREMDLAIHSEITPFADQFPFNIAGVPSLFFTRTNFPGGRWQHHSRHDTIANTSAAEVVRLLRAAHPMILDLASRNKWPFAARLPSRQHALARKLGRELLGPSRKIVGNSNSARE
jgi:hypothetical protein